VADSSSTDVLDEGTLARRRTTGLYEAVNSLAETPQPDTIVNTVSSGRHREAIREMSNENDNNIRNSGVRGGRITDVL
jgi:hypothetical protein